MKKYYDISSTEILTEEALHKRFSNVYNFQNSSFLDSNNIALIEEGSKPADIEGKVWVKDLEPHKFGTQWFLGFNTRPMIAEEVRAYRDSLLLSSDYKLAEDSPISPAKKAEWVAYRALLRAIPQQPNFPSVVDYPVMPNGN